MKITRRSFILAGTAVAAGAAGIHAVRSAHLVAGSEPRLLRIPPLLDARKQRQAIALSVQAGRTEFLSGRESETLGYNGGYLGPTIRLHRGDDVQVSVTNSLREATTVHWHGLTVPGELDGGPHQLIGPARHGGLSCRSANPRPRSFIIPMSMAKPRGRSTSVSPAC